MQLSNSSREPASVPTLSSGMGMGCKWRSLTNRTHTLGSRLRVHREEHAHEPEPSLNGHVLPESCPLGLLSACKTRRLLAGSRGVHVAAPCMSDVIVARNSALQRPVRPARCAAPPPPRSHGVGTSRGCLSTSPCSTSRDGRWSGAWAPNSNGDQPGFTVGPAQGHFAPFTVLLGKCNTGRCYTSAVDSRKWKTWGGSRRRVDTTLCHVVQCPPWRLHPHSYVWQ